MLIAKLLAGVDVFIRRAADGRQLRGLQLLVESMPQGQHEVPVPLSLADDSSLATFLAGAAQASYETLGLVPHPNQLVAAAGLVRGFLIELDTGEGKTLVGALAAAGLALAGRQVHVLTANDYLAQRDAEWMEPFYSALGLSSGVVLSTSTLAEKQAGYACDVTYAASREVGFDVLRDRLAKM